MTNRGPKGKRRYAMDYIADKTLYAAVMFARKMIREQASPGLSIHKAAQHYSVKMSDVAKYVGQAAGTLSHRKGGAA